MDTAVHFPTTPQAVKAGALALDKRMRVGQAFQAIARSCIAQIEGNAPGVTRFHDVESLHQMRVGLRRLRAALAMFDDVLHAPGDIETELDWLMGQLGPARDWDVLLASTLAQASRAMPREAKLAALKSAVQERVNTLHAQAAGAVASPRFDNLLATLTHWVDQRGWREGLSPKGERRCRQPVADFADAALENEQQRLVKRGRQLKGGDAVQLHRMRIACKRTRYATEFFASLYPGRRIRPMVASLAALQDALGALNDAAVAPGLLGELSGDDAALREASALVAGYLACQREQGAGALRRRWKKFLPIDLGH
jgi:triphosphatase